MVELANYVRPEMVIELSGGDVASALDELVAKLVEHGICRQPDLFLKRLHEREADSPTALGMGMAMPHAKLPDLDDTVLVVGRSRQGIDFGAPDEAPVHMVWLLAVGPDRAKYLKLVARIAWLTRNDSLRQQLFEAADARELADILQKY